MVKLDVMEHKPSLRGQIPPIKTTDNKMAHKISYMRRKESIKKKAMELSVLCGVKTCVVFFGPSGEVETWPENPSEVRAVIEMYKEYGKSSRDKRIGQFCEKNENDEPEIDAAKKERLRDVLLGCDDGWLSGLSAGSLRSLAEVLQTKLNALTRKIEFLKRLNEMSYLLECEEVAEPYGMTINVGMKNPCMVLQPQQHMIDLPSSEKDSTFDVSGQISAKPIPTWNDYGENPIKINGGNVSAPNRISGTPAWPPPNCCYGDFTSCCIIVDNRECLDSLSSETPIEPWNGYGDLGGNVNVIDMFKETNLDSISKPVSHFDPSSVTSSWSENVSVLNMFEETNLDSIGKPVSPFDPPPATSSWLENGFGSLLSSNDCELQRMDAQLLIKSRHLVSSNDSELQCIDPRLLANSMDLMSSNESELPWIDPQLVASSGIYPSAFKP